MKAYVKRFILALVLFVMGSCLSGCGHFADMEDDRPDLDPHDGVYVPSYVLDKMEEQRKTGKWRSQYE